MRSASCITFESEKNIRVMIFLDASSSMVSGSKFDNKLEYSIRAALLLAHLAIERRDQVGLIVFSDRLHYYIEPKASEGQFFRILEVLARVEGSGKKNLYGAVDYVTKRMKKDSFFSADQKDFSVELKFEKVFDNVSGKIVRIL
jgi:uncharacterized protein (DUF58 family)